MVVSAEQAVAPAWPRGLASPRAAAPAPGRPGLGKRKRSAPGGGCRTKGVAVGVPACPARATGRVRVALLASLPASQHDAQLDYYSRRLATCSSDKTVRIYTVAGGDHAFDGELTGHDGPVWEVSWAHPKFGTVLASCGYDRKAIVWRESTPGAWVAEHTIKADSSVNSVAWAPHEAGGLTLACASSDGNIRVATRSVGGAWEESEPLSDSTEGTLAVTWAPSTHLGAELAGKTTLRLATAGCDGSVRVWARTGADGAWVLDTNGLLSGHSRWVRDVAWAPATGLLANQLASCSEDGRVIVWEQRSVGGEWSPKTVRTFDAPVWRVSWSLTGGILAVTSGDPSGEAAVSLFKQTLLGDWAEVDAAEVDAAAA
ncbi:SEC13B, partial [Symbiodinium sp. KB8]